MSGRSYFGCALAMALLSAPAHAGRLSVLYAFKGGSDGAIPGTGVIADKHGNLYGTTWQGGGSGCGGAGCGTVFELTADGTETVLYAFQGGNDGITPNGLIRDADGNLYGTTQTGGGGCPGDGCGIVFKIAPDGTESVLHAFTGGNDGSIPEAALLRDSHGSLFGTTRIGGPQNGGTVFKIRPDGKEVVLYSFCSAPGCNDGDAPVANLIFGTSGSLYGTTSVGGTVGNGTVFKLKKDGSESVLYNFCSQFVCTDGTVPLAGLAMDSLGNLYGTTSEGGSAYGTVFRLSPGGVETVLHSFDPAAPNGDGMYPHAGVTIGSTGEIYGTTYQAQTANCNANHSVIYRLSPKGTEKLFCIPSTVLSGGLIERKGHLYGTANASAKNKYPYGFVFALKE